MQMFLKDHQLIKLTKKYRSGTYAKDITSVDNFMENYGMDMIDKMVVTNNNGTEIDGDCATQIEELNDLYSDVRHSIIE